jgi:hypothetical protein
MTGAETASETWDTNFILTRLIAREDFIAGPMQICFEQRTLLYFFTENLNLNVKKNKSIK